MPIDSRILDRFREEFLASRARAAGYQATIDALGAKLTTTQLQLDSELSAQSAMNEALVLLGQAPIA